MIKTVWNCLEVKNGLELKILQMNRLFTRKITGEGKHLHHLRILIRHAINRLLYWVGHERLNSSIVLYLYTMVAQLRALETPWTLYIVPRSSKRFLNCALTIYDAAYQFKPTPYNHTPNDDGTHTLREYACWIHQETCLEIKTFF